MTLGVRYANGGTSDRMFNAYLDHDYYVSAPPTGGWDKWDTAYVVMDAPQGEALLKFMSLTSDGAPNLDAFGFNLDGVCRVGADCATISLHPGAERVEPKLRGNLLLLTEHANVSVFDMNGSLVMRKSIDAGEVDLSTLVRANGLYRVMVQQGSKKLVATFAKVK